MKRKIWLVLLTLALAVSVCACGKNKEAEMEELGLGEFSDFEEQLMAEDAAWQAEQEAQAEIQSEYKVYDRAVEWDTVEEITLAVQVDETFLEIGVPVKEVVEKLQNADIEYGLYNDYYGDSEYTEDKICDGYGDIYVKRDGANWVTIKYVSPKWEMIPAGECIVYNYNIYDDALPFTWILGMNYDEYTAISYDQIESTFSEIINTDEVSQESYFYNFKNYPVKVNEVQSYVFESTTQVMFDTDTAKVTKISLNPGFPKEYHDNTPLESLENLPDGVWDKIHEKLDSICANNAMQSIELLEILMYRELDWEDKPEEDIKLVFYCRVIDKDGNEAYGTGSLTNPQLADGKYVIISETDYFAVASVYSSLEKAKMYVERDIEEIGRIVY